MSAWDKLSPTTINDCFLTRQNCMTEILRQRGGNNYKIPHVGKQKLRRAGELPTTFDVPNDVCDMYRLMAPAMFV